MDLKKLREQQPRSLSGDARFQKQGLRQFKESIGRMSGSRKREVLGAVKEQFAFGRKVSKAKTLVTVKKALGLDTKRQVEKRLAALTPREETAYLKMVKRNIKYARQERLAEEMQAEGRMPLLNRSISALSKRKVNQSGKRKVEEALMHRASAISQGQSSGYGGQPASGGSASISTAKTAPGGSASASSGKTDPGSNSTVSTYKPEVSKVGEKAKNKSTGLVI